jgi:hypothetical protein
MTRAGRIAQIVVIGLAGLALLNIVATLVQRS